MAEGGNIVWVVDHALRSKHRVSYWSEHTVADLVRRLRPAEFADLYELHHPEFGTLPEHYLMIDLGLAPTAHLELRERRHTGRVEERQSLKWRAVYHLTGGGGEAVEELMVSAPPSLTIGQLIAEAVPKLPRPGGPVERFFVEAGGEVLAPEATLAEIADLQSSGLTLRNRLRLRYRYGGEERTLLAHPSLTVDKILKDLSDGRHGAAFVGKALQILSAGQVLPGGSTLGSLKVRHDALVVLEEAGVVRPTPAVLPTPAPHLEESDRPLPERINFRLDDTLGNKERPVKVKGETTVIDLLVTLAEKYGCEAGSLALFDGGVELAADAVLGRVVKPDQLLQLRSRASGTTFQLPNGRGLALEIEPGENLDALCRRLAARGGLPGVVAIFVRGQRLPGVMAASDLKAYQALGLEVRPVAS